MLNVRIIQFNTAHSDLIVSKLHLLIFMVMTAKRRFLFSIRNTACHGHRQYA